jgi:acyl-CoA synthetase (AMP-forming)/AMP-acid ligase II
MIFRSRFPDVEVPNVPLSDYVFAGANSRGSTPALIDGPTGRTLTYGDLTRATSGFAGSLTRRGFRKGDVFAIYSPNLPEYAVAFHGVVRAGGTVTTANPLSTARELGQQLTDSGATYLLTVAPLLPTATEAARQTSVREIFVFGPAADGATPVASLMQSNEEPPDLTIDPENDLAALPYSSGTTGLPKGVMLTHRNLVANIVQTTAVITLAENERVIAVLPFYHIYGLTVLLNISLALGVTIVTMPRFDLEQFLRLIQDQHITRAYLVPPIVLALAKHPLVANYDMSSLLSINSGAAPLDGSVEQACADRVGCFVAQGYGLTETSPVVSSTPVDPALRRAGSAGLLIPNTECKVMDPTSGAELGSNEEGELWVRGPQVMKGYLKNPAATAGMLEPDGWLRTGDIGSVDAEGYLHVVDRLKELIKYKGFQVAPAELEGLLLTHPAVADAAVIPHPDEEAGEIPKAFVVLKAAATSDDLMTFVNQQVSPHKKIRALEIVNEIPKSPAGKILRRVLVERERAGAKP